MKTLVLYNDESRTENHQKCFQITNDPTSHTGMCIRKWGMGYEDEKEKDRDFPGGAVVKNPPANAEDTGSSPGLGRSHMLRSS